MPELVLHWPNEDAPIWRHARIDPAEGPTFDGIPDDVWRALSDTETRPRHARIEGGHLLVLRGVNVNPGDDLEDMVSLRLWRGPASLTSLTFRRVFAVEDTRVALDNGDCQADATSVMLYLAEALSVRIRNATIQMDEDAHAIEEALLDNPQGKTLADLQERVLGLRRRAVWLRRHLAPQHAALSDFMASAGRDLPHAQVEDLNEIISEAKRAAEAVQVLAEYGSLLQDRIEAVRSAQMGRTSHMLGLVAGVFLPLNLLAAVFGANVGGVPWSEDPMGFVWLTLVCIAITALGAWYLRRR